MTSAVAPSSTKSDRAHHKFYLAHEHRFLKVAIVPDDQIAQVDPKRLRFNIDNMLKAVFGVVGASKCEFDILSCRRPTPDEPFVALIRVRKSALETLWGALTMCTALDGKLCKIQVLHVSSTLLDMASDVIKFHRENRTEGCTTKAMDLAAGNDIWTSFGVGMSIEPRFLHENRSEGCRAETMNEAAMYQYRTEGNAVDAACLALLHGSLSVAGYFPIERWMLNKLFPRILMDRND
ncbi:TPA: hypothetical protein N0F65_003886 [Lagenidium giganteum]|uniref:Uncharacterized protein n=1 Tax=Lagenidium giganteum TaxID=4803 RepID=A0AAV2ZA35_9STRA|nr:TPA: hypothetical protein N0F65_003886 [Lagenidium giganteum]